MKFKELSNGDLSMVPDSAADFHRFLGIRVPSKRRYVYRYSRVTPYLLESLREGYLWFSKPSALNDPFDAKVLIDYRLSPDELKRHVHLPRAEGNRQNRRKVLRFQGEGQYSFALRYAIDAAEADLRDPRSVSRMLNIAKLAERSAFLDEVLGICCFTENPTNILMWSHYAWNHRGVCLRFRHRSSKDLSEHLLPVQYRSSVWMCRSKTDDTVAQARALLRSVLVKSSVWAYEREWRLVAFESGKSALVHTDLDGIIFGICTPEADKRAVLDELQDRRYGHVQVLQAYQHPLKYSLRILPEESNPRPASTPRRDASAEGSSRLEGRIGEDDF